MVGLDIRIAMGLGRPSWVGDGTAFGGADRLRVFPQRAGIVVGLAWFPVLTTRFKFGIRKADCELSCDGVELDDVTVADQADRAADGGFGPDMADAEARVAPENRPSVMSATLSPMPWP